MAGKKLHKKNTSVSVTIIL